MDINFKRLLYSRIGKMIISMLLGFGIATFFRRACNSRNCLVFHAPSLDKIEKQIFKYEDKCYVFKPESESCNNSKKTIEFA